MSYIEKEIEVTIVARVKVRMREQSLNAEEVQGFSDAFWPIAGPDDLMKHAAQRWVIENEPDYIEGIGAVGDLNLVPIACVDLQTLDFDICTEILPT